MSKPSLLPALRLSHKLEEEEFNQIFDEFYPRIVEVIFRLVGTLDEAEDLSADAFWKLWESPPASRDNLAGWLYRVATNLGYNHLRAGKRRTIYENRAGLQVLEQDAPSDPQEEAERQEERWQVRSALQKMPRRDVQILILRHSGLSYQEIATALQLQPSSVGSLLLRAERRFDRIYLKGEPHAPA